MITDTHCHLDVKPLYGDINDILKTARDKGVQRFIIPAIESDNMDRIISLVEQNNDIFFSTGNHPNRLKNYDLKLVEKYVAHPKCVAIGECGLDWYRIPKGSNLEDEKRKQIKIFSEQIELSIKYKKPLILHSRETDEDMVSVLSSYEKDLIGGVIHCYVGSDKLLELEKYNFYFGIGGVVTYKTATDLVRNLKNIPLDKILIETDAPYLTPEPYRGKTNKPEYTREVLNKIASIKEIGIAELELVITENTDRLFFN